MPIAVEGKAKITSVTPASGGWGIFNRPAHSDKSLAGLGLSLRGGQTVCRLDPRTPVADVIIAGP